MRHTEALRNGFRRGLEERGIADELMRQLGPRVDDPLHEGARKEARRLGDAELEWSARLAGTVFEQGLVTAGLVLAIECLPQLWQHAASPFSQT